MTAGSVAAGHLLTVEADADIDLALSRMREHQVKRMPVTDGDRLIGMISESDLVAELSAERVGQFAAGVYSRD